MIRCFDTDTQMAELLRQKPKPAVREAWKRKSVYATSSAEAFGLEPIEAYPEVLIPKDSFKDAIIECTKPENLVFPLHHQYRTWAPKGFRSNQNGIGYCWTWSGTAGVMDVRAIEDKDMVMLAPVSMGYLVGWADRGNYLESFIKGAKEAGICPGEFNSHERRSSLWPMDGERKNFRLGQVWDTDNSDKITMLQHCLSILVFGRPLYIAYNWWGHALEMIGIRWTEGTYQNITVQIRNSHNEDDIIELTGSRCIPDEAYGFISTLAV